MIASTFFDLVVGVDMHFEMVPMPAPVPTPFPHPFMGMVFDPGGLVSGLIISNAIGMIAGAPPQGPVLINFMPATNTGTDVKNKMVLPHFVIPPGTMWTPMPKAPKPKIGAHAAPAPDLPVAPAGDAVLMMGSKTVAIMGSNAVRLGDLAMSCSEPVRLPSSVVLAIPKGPLVLVGGPPAIDWQQALGALLRSKWVSNHLHGLVSRIKNVRVRNFLHRAVCFLTGHPVDVATGRVLTSAIDFELPGPLPLRFERNYASSWSDRESVLGFGWSHSLDQAVWLERGKVVYRAEDGREIEFDTFDFPDHAMRKGDSCYDPFNRLTLRSLGQFRWEIENAEGLTHEFAPVLGDSRKGYARLISQRTRDGHAIQLAYDAQGCLEWVTDSGGRRILFAHDEKSRLTRVALPHPREQKWVTHTRYVYSPEGDLVEVHDAQGNVARWAYEGHLLVRETDRTGLSFYFGYDGAGSDAYCIRTWGDGGIYDHEILYDKQNHVTAVTNSLGHTTMYFANAMNAVVKVMDPLGGETKYEYDDSLYRTAETDPLKHTTRYEYDARGNRTKVIKPDGATVTTRYDAFNHPVAETDAAGGTWTRRYDSQGHMVEETNPLGESRRFEYAKGLLSSIVEPGGEPITLEYDTNKNIACVRFPTGIEGRLAYDRLGRVVYQKDARGAEWHVSHDALGREVEVATPVGTWRKRYDAEGSLLEQKSPSRHVHFGYEGFRRLAYQEEAGTRVSFLHDTEGQLVAATNEAGETYRFILDALGRVVREEGFDGKTREYGYDAAGRLTRILQPNGQWEKFAHDAAGRMTEVRYADGSFHLFRYRQDGALLEAEDASGTLVLERDALGRVVGERQGEYFVRSRYSVDGRRSLVETSLGARLAVVQDALGETRTLHLGRDFAHQPSIHIERDKAGLEVARRLPGGVAIQWQRDAIGRPIERRILHEAGEATRQTHSRSFQWEGEDQLVTVLDSETGSTLYAHDERGRLVGAQDLNGTLHRQLDAVGNVYRAQNGRDRRYGPGGRLLDADGTTYEHDKSGRLSLKRSSDGNTWKYKWNAAGLLAEVESQEGRKVRFEYDAFSRRTRKTTVRVAKDATETIERETRFIWDGDVVIHEVSSSQKPTTWYWEPESFNPVAMESDGRCWPVAVDQLGTPTEMYDDAGQLVWKMQLDIFGRGTTALALQACPWRWPGQYADEETGLYYSRFRYYDPGLGRFLVLDPAGLQGGFNLYAYVFDPTVQIDPLGLDCYEANRAPGGIAKGKKLTDRQALDRIRRGLDVFADSMGEARSLAKRALKGKPMRHGPHGDGYYPHFHPNQHANSSHVFYP